MSKVPERYEDQLVDVWIVEYDDRRLIVLRTPTCEQALILDEAESVYMKLKDALDLARNPDYTVPESKPRQAAQRSPAKQAARPRQSALDVLEL